MLRIFTLSFISILFLNSCSSSKNDAAESMYPADLAMITHADWGWQPLTQTKETHEISKITIHHGGEDFPDDKDPVKYLQGLQSWSQSEKNWIDIPYHFMIDLKGNIYETRPIEYPGDTNTSYDPTGHALICVMGNYENQVVSTDQLDALVKLTAFLADKYKVSTENIAGHKDFTDTLCPGKDLYRYLEDGTIRRRVAELLK